MNSNDDRLIQVPAISENVLWSIINANGQEIVRLQQQRDQLKAENETLRDRVEDLCHQVERCLPIPSSMPSMPDWDDRWTDQMKMDWMKCYELLLDIKLKELDDE